MTPEDLKLMADKLTASGKYMVLKRHEPPVRYAADDGADKRIGIVLDTECTGLDYKTDQVIELALVSFEYCPKSGTIYHVLDIFDEYADPGCPIPPAITELTGITNEMVAGKRIDLERVSQLVGQASIIIAHNAGFDRKFVEAAYPGIFESKPWACSLSELDWSSEGCMSAKLEYLAFRFGFVFDGHRASNDCQALLEILAGRMPKSGNPVLAKLLERARQQTVRIYAVGSPFETKGLLKARGYRWGDGTDGKPKAWWREISGKTRGEELIFLKNEIFSGRERKLPEDLLDATVRFSARI